jgi:GNAT superfamily N-acetyltransferase
MLQAPHALNRQHLVNGFDCGKPSLNDWLIRHSLQAQGSGSSKTFVVSDGQVVAGYFSLTLGQIDTFEAPERVRQGMGQYPIPVVLLARLAVDLHYARQGIGAGLPKDAIKRAFLIAEQAGVRAIITHPLDHDADRFYTRFGFAPSPAGHNLLILLLKDARKFIA